MIIKVCGMREPQNIREVAALAINWIGFIFYERSKRFVERCPTEQQVTDSEQLSPKKVGVFVNATIESMMEKASAYKLDYLQLHGNESPEDCHTLQKRGYSLIKAFPIATKEDFEKQGNMRAGWIISFSIRDARAMEAQANVSIGLS